MNKIKIIRFTTVSLTMNVLLREQLKFLNNNFEIIAISSPGKDLDEVKVREGVRVLPIKIERDIHLLKDIISFFKILYALKVEKPTIIHSNTPKSSLLSMLAGYFLRVPIRIYTITGLRFEGSVGLKRKFLIGFEKLTCFFSTHVLAESIGVRNKVISENILKKKLFLLSPSNLNGVNTEVFNPNLSYPDYRQKYNLLISDFVFLFIGRISRDKGVFELLDAFNNIEKKLKNAKLIILGTKELSRSDSFKFDIKTLKSKNIIINGFEIDIRPYLNICNCLVLPSYREGFPNVILEAGSMGKPVIMTNVNGSDEYINNYNGSIVSIRNSAELYEKMNHMIVNKNNYIPTAIRNFTINNFSSDKVHNELEKFYNLLIQSYYNDK